MPDSAPPSVVIVDDEEMVITSLRAFLRLETDFQVHGFTQPEEAVKFLQGAEVDSVVSDYLMPGMNGIQLLGRAKELQPEASRILLTGHADKQSAILAINEISLYQYIEKPWENAALLLILKSATERTRLLRELAEKISELDMAHGNLKDMQKRLIKAFL